MADTLSAGFGAPFPEQMAALELRLANKVPTATWQDLRRAEHEHAFVVAGAIKADLLDDIGTETLRAIGEHRSIAKFREEFRQIVAKRGWHGWTGEGTAKGEAWRTKVIYRTNMATSYAAGRMAQIVAANYKYWIYKHGNSVEPRLQHLAWDGLALPPDHEFWKTHAPPNGWGCTCRIAGAISERGIIAAGGDPAKTLPADWQAIDPKTGAQVGIDKGWDYEVGASVASDINGAVAAKLAKLPAPIGSDFGQSIAPAIDAAWSNWVTETIATGGRTRPGLAGVLGADVIDALERRTIAPLTAEVQVRPGLLAGPKATRHELAGNALAVEDWTSLPERLRSPLAVLLDKDSGNLLYILPARAGRAQIAITLDYRMKGSEGAVSTNMIISAYRPVIAEVMRRLSSGTLELVMGSVR